MLNYLDELHERLHSFAERAAAVPAGEHGSVEWVREIGRFWRGLRESEGTSRYETAYRLGIHVNELRLFESGVTVSNLISGDFPLRYAQTLGKPDVYPEFCQRFGIPEFVPSQIPQ